MQRTFSIIKPDAVQNGLAGKVLSAIEADGFKIAGLRFIHMSKQEAETFYAVHSARGFFAGLVEFMTSGPCIVMALDRENAVLRLREIMGKTNPADAAEGTIRKMYAESIERNAIHGSDSPENAAVEVAFFFRGTDFL
jgi:nucleoside-diphosphate kinase